MADESNQPAILKPVFGVFAILGWVLLMGLHVVWHYSFGWLFTTLANLLDAVSIPTGFFGRKHLFGTVSAWLRSLDRNVDNALVHAANGLEHSAVWLFSRVGAFFGWVAGEIKAVALTVEHAVRKLITVTIPRLIHKALQLVWRELRSLGRYARKLIPKLARDLLHFAKWTRHFIGENWKKLRSVAKWARFAFKAMFADIVALWKLFHYLNKRFTPKPFRGLVAGALHGLGLAAWWATNPLALADWLIRQPLDVVYEFVKDAVRIVGTTDICKLAAYQVDVAVFIFDPVMQALIGVTNFVCFYSGDELPSATKGTAEYLEAWAPTATPAIAEPFVPDRLAPDLPLPRGVIEA